MVLKLYMMYILYLSHGKDLKDKALPLIWFFVNRRSGSMPMVSRDSQAQFFLEYHVNLQFNKMPQLAMHCNVKEMGA